MGVDGSNSLLNRLRRDRNRALPSLPPDPRLPQELIERVIEYCAWHERTLRACSLVSRSWVTPSRRYLFGIIRLHTHGSVAAFLHLLASTTCNILCFVRKLDIVEFDDQGSRNPSKAWMRQLFHQLPHFPYLECVAFQMFPNSYHWKWGSHLSKDIRVAFFDLFIGITKLELSAMFSSFYELCELICSFPRLRILVLNGANWQTGPSGSDPILTIPALQDLSLGITSSKQVLITWILTGSTKEALLDTGSVRFTSIRQTESPAIATYLHAIGPFLESLELEFSGLEAFYIADADNPKLKIPHRAFITLIDIAHNSNLRHLHLSNLLLGETRGTGILFYGFPPAKWVVTMLSQVSSPLEELRLTVVIEKHSKRINSEDLDAIASALAWPRFPKLKLLWWDFVQSSMGDRYWKMDVEWDKHDIRKAFSAAEWKGVLRISESR